MRSIPVSTSANHLGLDVQSTQVPTAPYGKVYVEWRQAAGKDRITAALPAPDRALTLGSAPGHELWLWWQPPGTLADEVEEAQLDKDTYAGSHS